MSDYLIRGTALAGRVRAFAVQTAVLTEELSRRHQTTPTATAALGRTVAAGLLIGAMLKGEEHLIIQVKGDGPIGQIRYGLRPSNTSQSMTPMRLSGSSGCTHT